MNKTAVVITPYGTSTTASATYDFYEERLKSRVSDVDVFRAYTSDKIRENANKSLPKDSPERLLSVAEQTEKLIAMGYEKIFFNSLHVFMALEFNKIVEQIKPHMSNPDVIVKTTAPLIVTNNTMLAVLEKMEEYFAEDKLNLLAMHGSKTQSKLYKDFKRVAESQYKNVLAAAVDGEPEDKPMLEKAIKKDFDKINIIPFMFVAGRHAEEDLMGKTDSWKSFLENAGKTVECETVEMDGNKIFKGLGFRENIADMYIDLLTSTIERTYV